MRRRVTRSAEADEGPVATAAELEEEEEAGTCAICLEPMTDAASAVPLSCSHRFHATCLIPWLQKGNRSCPTCREKPPRQRLGGGSESDASGYGSDGYGSTGGYESEDDEGHRALHDSWEATWAAWLASFRNSERLRKRAVTKAKALARKTGARAGDQASHKQAKRLVRSLEQWQEKAKARKLKADEASKAARQSEQRRQKKAAEVYRWYRKQLDILETKRVAKLTGADQECATMRRQALAAARASQQAHQAVSRAEASLAKVAGWEELSWSAHPRLPQELQGCVYDPYHGGPSSEAPLPQVYYGNGMNHLGFNSGY